VPAVKIAIVGCGYVADLYVSTIALHKSLEVVGVFDIDEARLRQFCGHYRLDAYSPFDDLLADSRVQIVVNLTNPRAHFGVSAAALEAGKHVYSEKPLAMSYEEAERLVELAEKRGLLLAGAPATLLSETAQTVWKGIRDGVVGRVRLVYAEMDEGLLPKFAYSKWFSASGKQWPFRDEFEIGCTLEHAGYVLSWLAAMFGPAKSVTAFSSELDPEKLGPTSDLKPAADFSVACILFENGVVARMTNSVIAPHDHQFRVFGDDGVLSVSETWHSRSPVTVRPWIRIRRRTLLSPIPKRLRLLGKHLPSPRSGGSQVIDFARGIADLADAANQGRSPRLSARFALHISELALAIQYATESSHTYTLKSTFEPVQPMDWAM
jgi:predicted dehydrogenase